MSSKCTYPHFIQEVVNGDFEKAYEIITTENALPAICGRVCPQENQCEGKCIRGIKGESVAIGRLEDSLLITIEIMVNQLKLRLKRMARKLLL